jgi:hypothetical protein
MPKEKKFLDPNSLTRPRNTLARGENRKPPKIAEAVDEPRARIIGVDRDLQTYGPTSCPRFSRCSAPICPLDLEWGKRTVLNNESVCFYLLEHAKEASKDRFRRRGLWELYEVIGGVLPDQSSKWRRIARAYERAKASGSRLEKLPVWVKGKEHVET